MHPVSQSVQPTKLKEALPGPAVTTNNREGDAAWRAYAISKCCIPPPPTPPPSPRMFSPQNVGWEERGPLPSLPATVGFLAGATLQSNQYRLNYHAPDISFTLWPLCRTGREGGGGEKQGEGTKWQMEPRKDESAATKEEGGVGRGRASRPLVERRRHMRRGKSRNL